MNKEKMLYHAKTNGRLTFEQRQCTGVIIDNLQFLIDGGFLLWETNDLWDEHVSEGNTKDYDKALHVYSITKDGEVLLAIYRLEYAHKNERDTSHHNRRIDELNDVLKASEHPIEYYKPILTKNQLKALRYAAGECWKKQDNHVHIIPDTLSPFNVVPHEEWVRMEKNLDRISLDELSLVSMFNMSTGLGPKGTDATRHEDYVMKKCVEELGELALEINISQGLSYKEQGKDGIKGEAVDLAICALDMFALQCHNMTPEEIEREFLSYMLTKLNKWKDTLK